MKNFIEREDYDSKGLLNDIAIIELDEEIEFNENVAPVKLPSEDTHSEIDEHVNFHTFCLNL